MRYNAWATVLIGLSALCWTSCGSTKQISRETETRANTNYTNVTNERDSVVIAERDTLKEVTTITVQLNEIGDTVKVSTITDRTRASSRDRVRDVGIKVVERTDTVYIEKRDSIYVQNTGLTNPTDTTKGSGLSELFLCHDSGKPKRAWSLRSLLHRFRATLKWIFWILIGLIGLIVTVKVCSLRR